MTGWLFTWCITALCIFLSRNKECKKSFLCISLFYRCELWGLKYSQCKIWGYSIELQLRSLAGCGRVQGDWWVMQKECTGRFVPSCSCHVPDSEEYELLPWSQNRVPSWDVDDSGACRLKEKRFPHKVYKHSCTWLEAHLTLPTLKMPRKVLVISKIAVLVSLIRNLKWKGKPII